MDTAERERSRLAGHVRDGKGRLHAAKQGLGEGQRHLLRLRRKLNSFFEPFSFLLFLMISSAMEAWPIFSFNLINDVGMILKQRALRPLRSYSIKRHYGYRNGGSSEQITINYSLKYE